MKKQLRKTTMLTSALYGYELEHAYVCTHSRTHRHVSQAGMVVHAYNPRNRETKTGGLRVESQP